MAQTTPPTTSHHRRSTTGIGRAPALALAGAGLLVAGGLLGGFATRTGTVSGAEAAMSAEAVDAAHSADAAAYTVDATHSHVVFRTTHLGTSHAYGMFHEPMGSLSFDPAGETVSDIEVRVDAGKVDTGHDGRDNHLRGGDFFSASEFPAIVFKSTETADLSSGSDTVAGSLTMLGRTVPVEVKVSMVGTGTHPRNGASLAGFAAEFTIKRTDFGMNYGVDQGALGDEVHLTVAIEAVAE